MNAGTFGKPSVDAIKRERDRLAGGTEQRLGLGRGGRRARFELAQAANQLQHGLALADRGLRAIAEDKHLRNGLNVHKGRVTNRPVAEALGYEAYAAESVLNVA